MLKGFDTAFDWNEFPEFVDAWVSAQKVVGEWAKDLSRLWDATWGNSFEMNIPYASRAEALQGLENGGIFEAWWDGWYQRAILTPAFGPVALAVFYDEQGDQEGFHLQIEFATKHKEFLVPKWSSDDNVEWDSGFSELNFRQQFATLDLHRLRAAAVDALQALKVRPLT